MHSFVDRGSSISPYWSFSNSWQSREQNGLDAYANRIWLDDGCVWLRLTSKANQSEIKRHYRNYYNWILEAQTSLADIAAALRQNQSTAAINELTMNHECSFTKEVRQELQQRANSPTVGDLRFEQIVLTKWRFVAVGARDTLPPSMNHAATAVVEQSPAWRTPAGNGGRGSRWGRGARAAARWGSGPTATGRGRGRAGSPARTSLPPATCRWSLARPASVDLDLPAGASSPQPGSRW